MLFQAFMTYFLLWNTKEDISKNGDHKNSDPIESMGTETVWKYLFKFLLFGGQNCTIISYNCGWMK